MSLRCVDLFR